MKWRWKEKEIEEIKNFTYLEYTVQSNGGQKMHVRERLRKGMAVMRPIWGMGKRRFGCNWGKRVWLFDRLVWAVIGYGVEV